MKQTRLLFILLLALTLATVGVVSYFGYSDAPTISQRFGLADPQVGAITPEPTAITTPLDATKPGPATLLPITTIVAANEVSKRFLPVWGPNYKEDDGLGKVICATYAFSADYPLHQIQMSGLDIKRGFHLGIVPFYLDENYVVTAVERSNLLKSGQIDCLLMTFDQIALENPGVLTAFINESAGGDQLWARNVKSLNDMKGKRIAFEANGPSAFFVYDLLATVKLTPEDVTLLAQPNQDVAIAVFNNNDADVVAGWQPTINAAAQSGGQILASSKDFRSIVGGVVISRQAMKDKVTVLQLFHEAWFEALALQEHDFASAAKQIASWGHNDYLGVKPETAEADLRGLLSGVAQANLADNVRSFANMTAVVDRLLQARRLWADAGNTVADGDVTQIIEPEFVQKLALGKTFDFEAPNGFVNNTFSMGRTRAVEPASDSAAAANITTTTGVTATEPVAVATLPCTRFEFEPNTAQLKPESETELRDCALRILKQNLNLYVQVKGSSAWPGPKGTIKQELVEETAKERAQAVVDYLVGQGINEGRFQVDWTLPPEDHRETTDLNKQALDRYVELSLLVSGL